MPQAETPSRITVLIPKMRPGIRAADTKRISVACPIDIMAAASVRKSLVFSGTNQQNC